MLAVMTVVDGCSKNLPDGNGHSGGGTDIIDEPLEELPPLDDVDDVCEKMVDINFMSYCYQKFDVNADGRVSMTEANAVRTIECDSAENFSGIEYFSNLERFKSSSVQTETVDLRYNKKLLSVDCKGTPIVAIDLRYNTRLQEMLFEDCFNLEKVLLPSDLDIISDLAFCNTAITHFVIPDSVKEIGASAFENCSSLESVTISEDVVMIREGAFYGCCSLTSVILPASICNIGYQAFNGIPLTKVICLAFDPPTLFEIDDFLHPFSYVIPELYVPLSSVEAYKNSSWADWFKQILPIE